MFNAPKATAFPIENRQGLHDQSLNAVFPKVNQLLGQLDSSSQFDREGFEMVSSADKGKGKASQEEAYVEIANWLADWHLIVFLSTCGIFETAEIKLITQIAAKKDVADVKKLLQSSAWKTFASIAREHACEFSPHTPVIYAAYMVFSCPAEQPAKASGDASMGQFETDADGFPIIPPDHDMMRTDTPPLAQPGSSMGGTPNIEDFSHIPDIDAPAGGGPGGGGTIVCPHCTFENPASAVDCEICSLPLR